MNGGTDGRDGSLVTLRRGLALSPELREGLALTLVLGVLGTGGRVAVPIVIQRAIDQGLGAPGGVNVGTVAVSAGIAAVAVVVTAVAGWMMNYRLARSTESALSGLRRRTFAHIHDQSALTQQAQRRGALVARVTDDVDQMSQFMQWGGVSLVVNVGQVLLASLVMLFYSPVLTLVVLACFIPYLLLLRWFQGRLSRAYDLVRTRVGAVLSSVAETVVAAPVIKAYGARERAQARIDEALDDHYRARFRAVRVAAVMYSTSDIIAAGATAAVIAVGLWLGVGGRLGGPTAGSLIAFLFLVSLFVSPVQTVTEVLDQAQSAIAGWRRVLQVLDVPSDLSDPVEGVDLPEGDLDIAFLGVSFTYPEATAPALRDVDLRLAHGTVTAVVGETGSGKTTLGRLVSRLTDPTEGTVCVGGVDLRTVRFASLRRRVLLVPQDGFLFDSTILANVAVAGRGLERPTVAEVSDAFERVGLGPWLADLPAGLATPTGERGAALSVGERQLVALARAALADPDILVLDEATSAVDPATEMRVNTAFDRLLEGRTAIVIAHRLSVAERADRILVVDAGRIVEDGTHAELLAVDGHYAHLHRQWRRSTGMAA